MSTEHLLKISAHYLHDLPASQRVLEKVEPQVVEDLVIRGLEQLINRFNTTGTKDPLYNYSPGVQRLKRLLEHDHVDTLPLPSEITTWQFKAGLTAAKEPMLLGRQIKEGTLPDTDLNRKSAILVPSLNTTDIALAVGTGLHIYERTVMVMMIQRLSNHWWLQDKDVVLHALEDVALWMHAENVNGQGPEAILFPLITTPPSDGGLGWKSASQAQLIINVHQQTSPPQPPLDPLRRKQNYLRWGATGRTRRGL